MVSQQAVQAILDGIRIWLMSFFLALTLLFGVWGIVLLARFAAALRCEL